jgi:hypothetical protein
MAATGFKDKEVIVQLTKENNEMRQMLQECYEKIGAIILKDKRKPVDEAEITAACNKMIQGAPIIKKNYNAIDKYTNPDEYVEAIKVQNRIMDAFSAMCKKYYKGSFALKSTLAFDDIKTALKYIAEGEKMNQKEFEKYLMQFLE